MSCLLVHSAAQNGHFFQQPWKNWPNLLNGFCPILCNRSTVILANSDAILLTTLSIASISVRARNDRSALLSLLKTATSYSFKLTALPTCMRNSSCHSQMPFAAAFVACTECSADCLINSATSCSLLSVTLCRLSLSLHNSARHS